MFILDSDTKNDAYEFDNQVVDSDEINETSKCSNNYTNKSETKEIKRTVECLDLRKLDTDSQENLIDSFSIYQSSGTAEEETKNTTDAAAKTDNNEGSEPSNDVSDIVVEDNLNLNDTSDRKEDLETTEGTSSHTDDNNHDRKLSKDERLNTSENGKDCVQNSNKEQDPIVVSGSVLIDQETIIETAEKDAVNTDSYELTTTSNEEETEGAYSLLGDINDTNESIEEKELILKPMTNIQKDKENSASSKLPEELAVIDKSDINEDAGTVDDETSSSNSDKSPTSRSSSTHVSTFGVWDVQPVLNTEEDDEEGELVSSEKEENENAELKKNKKRRSKKK